MNKKTALWIMAAGAAMVAANAMFKTAAGEGRVYGVGAPLEGLDKALPHPEIGTYRLRLGDWVLLTGAALYAWKEWGS